MEKNQNKIFMEHSRVSKQYNSVEHGNGEFPHATQAFMPDPMTSLNMSIRPPELKGSDVKPVLNYSIQTGEEFSFEFMRDRLNPRKHFIQNSLGEPSYATGYMDLKGLLGISRTESESGSDISMLNMVEKGPRGFERKDSVHENQSNYGSHQSMRQTTLGYENNRGLLYMSIGTSDGTSTRMKVLCSFGGKILPRPSDRKLRYVGDEDLQNMMEECNELLDKEASQKLRMFLFSLSDLEDTQFGLGNMDGDSEIQYVVAVNGMDFGTRTSTTLHGLTSFSANNLTEPVGTSINRETSRVAGDSVVISSSNIPGIMVSSSTFQSSQPVLPSSSGAYETRPEFYHGQRMGYPLQYGHNSSNYSYIAEFSNSVPPNGFMNQHERLTEVPPYNGLQQQNLQMLATEFKPKPDGSGHQGNDLEKHRPSETDHPVSSRLHEGKVINHFQCEEVPVAVVPQDVPHFTLKNEAKNQENEKVASSVDAVNEVLVPKQGNDDHHSTSSYADSESNPTDLSYHEPTVPPHKVYYSERIPREQLDLLNRLSKSDDSLGSQLLLAHPQSDMAQQFPNTETVGNLCDTNIASHIEKSAAKLSNKTTDDEISQRQKHKEFPVAVSLMNSKPSEEVLDTGLKQAVSNPMDNIQAPNKDGVQVGFPKDNLSVDEKKPTFDVKAETGPGLPVGNESAFALPHDANLTSKNPPVHFQVDLRTESSTKDDSKENHSSGIIRAEQGDILIDINDRFPRDFLSDIFSKAMLSEESSGVSPLQTDGAGLSLNMENHEPKRWSYFQKLAQDFGEKDGSLINQDHVSDQFAPVGVVPLSQAESDKKIGEDNPKDGQPQVQISESMQFDAMIENLRTPESEYEKTKSEKRNIGLPPLDPSLGEFDINTLQKRTRTYFDSDDCNLLDRSSRRIASARMMDDIGNSLGESIVESESVDVFSFGIVLWEILTGEEPYANMHYGAIIASQSKSLRGGIVSNTLRPTIPSFCDPEWRKLMEQCWSPNPAARPSFTEIASRLRTMSAAASQSKVQGHKASK
ncbi:hypothetical protein GOBAR_DD13910 [Gossypium barbadense]|nr:hypothetical protein GOBAR_DD13910 [Gossypium barbadense]